MAIDIIPSRSAAIIGSGPAGLMAAEVLNAGGVRVDVYDAMPSAGRKFLLAGKGGLNLTHRTIRGIPRALWYRGCTAQTVA